MADVLSRALLFCAAQARWVLVAGLAAGLVFQPLASLVKPLIPVFIAALLFTASLRIGFSEVRGAVSVLRNHLFYTLILQVVFPLICLVVATVAGIGGVYLLAIVLVAAASPISGSPNLVIMLGHEPVPALRQLIVGTALLPLTVIPVFLWLPELGDTMMIASASLKLLLVICLSAIAGFVLRARCFPRLSSDDVSRIDGLSAVLMAVVVIGLMSALGEAFRFRPWALVLMLLFAFLVNLGFQGLGHWLWKTVERDPYRVSLSVISGNRNIALYLTALPAGVTEPLLLFIGCYQFPMYLTPLVMRRFYAA